MELLASKRILALSNPDKEVLLRLLALEGRMGFKDIKQHIELKDEVLAQHLEDLKKAKLIKNNTIEERGRPVRIFSITADGIHFLKKMGCKF